MKISEKRVTNQEKGWGRRKELNPWVSDFRDRGTQFSTTKAADGTTITNELWKKAACGLAPEKFAIISDVHGNLAALESVLSYLESRNIDRIYCLGDVVGYGPHPAECLRLIRKRQIPCLRGNHEAYALAAQVPRNLHRDAVAGIRHARNVLFAEDRQFIETWPDEVVLHGMSFVHASYPDPAEWDYLSDQRAARCHLAAQPTFISFFGHTHRQGGFRCHGGRIEPLIPDQSVKLSGITVLAINPGSVGQPRDADQRAALAVFCRGRGVVEFHRVSYDIDRTVAALAEAGFPPRMGHRLAVGR
jgi:predicted phosphodiesterase